VGGINLAHDRGTWRAFVNKIMNLRGLHKIMGIINYYKLLKKDSAPWTNFETLNLSSRSLCEQLI
jgi:hypothetical protein